MEKKRLDWKEESMEGKINRKGKNIEIAVNQLFKLVTKIKRKENEGREKDI